MDEDHVLGQVCAALIHCVIVQGTLRWKSPAKVTGVCLFHPWLQGHVTWFLKTHQTGDKEA